MYKLSINNYRSFLQEDFNFSRVNILIGENSSGKSSLIKFLLLLKQTIDSPKESNLVLSGELADTGNYKETIYYHKSEKNILFKFTFDKSYHDFFLKTMFGKQRNLPKSIQNERELISQQLAKAFKSETSIEYEISKELEIHQSIKTKITNTEIGQLIITPIDDPLVFDNMMLTGFVPKCDLVLIKKDKKYNISNVGFEKRGFMTIVLGHDLDDRINATFKKESDEFKLKIYHEIAFLLITQNNIETQLGKIKFINPINYSPKRIYFKKDVKGVYKNMDLEKFVGLIESNQLHPTFIKVFERMLLNLGLAEDLKVIGTKHLPVLELRVKIKDLISNISDVGYGVSLQLPILFEALNSETRNGSTIILEQPEVHLHPKLQSKFIETLLSIGSKNKYIIETHSEHIIRMLQVLVKEKRNGLKPSDISIYYFRREKKKSVITHHKINESGKLEPSFPEGFFDASYQLAKQLLF
jgi:predicted ATPase